MSEDLKPCPFCGEVPDFFKDYNYSGSAKECWEISCCVRMADLYGPREKAFAAWNRRTQSSELARLNAVMQVASKFLGPDRPLCPSDMTESEKYELLMEGAYELLTNALKKAQENQP